jgi:hypothetical protein
MKKPPIFEMCIKRPLLLFLFRKEISRTAERHLLQTVGNAFILRNPVNLRELSPLPFPVIQKYGLA